jgi:cytochrome o ubiquinol oxidase operon protein cyoD
MRDPKLKAYIYGFAGSLACTMLAYVLVVTHVAADARNPVTILLTAVIASLALAQFAIQLRYFLHLGDEARPRWKLLSFGFMTLIVVILVLGSVWIMANLNYHTKMPTATDKSIIQDEGITP